MMQIIKNIFLGSKKKILKLFSKIIEGVVVIFQKFYGEVWLAVALIFALILTRPILIFFLGIGDGTLLQIFIATILSFVVVYVYLAKERPTFLNTHQGFLTVFGIFIPVALSLLQSTVISSDSYWRAEILLKEENNRNINHLESIKTDLTSNSNVNFWRDFSLRAYQENWPHLQKYYSQDCKNLYMAITVHFGILNNVNNLRRSLPIEEAQALTPWQAGRFAQIEKSYTDNMLQTASSTLPLAYRIVSECQQIDQRTKNDKQNE